MSFIFIIEFIHKHLWVIVEIVLQSLQGLQMFDLIYVGVSYKTQYKAIKYTILSQIRQQNNLGMLVADELHLGANTRLLQVIYCFAHINTGPHYFFYKTCCQFFKQIFHSQYI